MAKCHCPLTLLNPNWTCFIPFEPPTKSYDGSLRQWNADFYMILLQFFISTHPVTDSLYEAHLHLMSGSSDPLLTFTQIPWLNHKHICDRK